MLKRKSPPSLLSSADHSDSNSSHSTAIDSAVSVKRSHNDIDYKITDSGNTNMKVIVRVRPENQSELRGNCETVVKALDQHVVVFDPKDDNMPQFEKGGSLIRNRRPFLSKKHKDLRFAFDRVFDETSTQHEVFETSTKPIIDGLLDGVNCSVFAYGATGAGKTHTMLGSQEDPGVMFLTTMELYKRIEQLKFEKTCEVAVTYLEIYNETIRDLLEPSGALAMREDGQNGLVVSGLSQHQPSSAEDLLRMLAEGNKNRTQHPTDANATSSRSHAVFQIYINQRARSGGLTAEVTQGKMSLIDLAGSERGTATSNRGARMREGANINRSLLALGNCINALAANKGKSTHVPYRNSKLTRLLKDSLGGNCRTVMIANISPSGLTYEDTYNTLRYADRAKQIKTKLVRNVVNVDYHVTRYRTIVIELQKEIDELKTRVCCSDTISTSSNILESEEVSRLQCTVQDIYNERGGLRKSMADLDANERDALLRIFRKEKDLQRVEVLTGNDRKISKIQNKLDHLHSRLKSVKEQKTVLHQQLSSNNDKIYKMQSDIGVTARGSSETLSKHMELVTEARKLEAECSHQWKQTKHLLRYIKNQEKEISRTEKMFLLSLELVRKQYQLLSATNCLTPVVRDLFDSLVRQIEGEKEVIWANDSELQDSLCNISVSSLTSSHQALFDSIVSHNSPIRKGTMSRYSSPTSSASLGILANFDGNKEQALPKSPPAAPHRSAKSQHPLTERRVATPSVTATPTHPDASFSGSLPGKLLTERKGWSPLPPTHSNERIVSSPTTSNINLSELTRIATPPVPPRKLHVSPTSLPPLLPPSIRPSLSAPSLPPPSFPSSYNGFEDNFVPSDFTRPMTTPPTARPVAHSNRASPKAYITTPNGLQLPVPRTTPTRPSNPFQYPPLATFKSSFTPPAVSPFPSLSPAPPFYSSSYNNTQDKREMYSSSERIHLTPNSSHFSNPLYMRSISINTPPINTTSNYHYNDNDDDIAQTYPPIDLSPTTETSTSGLNSTFIVQRQNRPPPPSGGPPTRLDLSKNPRTRKNKKSPVKLPVKGGGALSSVQLNGPILTSTSTHEGHHKGNPPRYLTLTKSAAIKRLPNNRTISTSNGGNSFHIQKENKQPSFTRSVQYKPHYRAPAAPPFGRVVNPRTQSTSS